MVAVHWPRTRLVHTAATPAQLPRDALPSVMAAGASNVGKSSLLGALFGRPKLVRTSKTPGRTRALLFFEVDARFRLVDLPGYGFARVPPAEQARWRALVEAALRTLRPRLVLVLMDVRHAPKPSDLQLIAWLGAEGLRWLPVLTKADKLGRGQRLRRAREVEASVGVRPLLTSSRSGEGVAELRDAILQELSAE